MDSDSGGPGQDGEVYEETLAASLNSSSAALIDGIPPRLRATGQGPVHSVTPKMAMLNGLLTERVSRLGAMLSLLMALLLSGCASVRSGTYPTFKDTDAHVSWPMTQYRNAVIAGHVTLGEREQVNAAYAQYKAAFDEALQAAHNNRDAPTPENVKALANEILRILWAMPY